MLLIHRRYIIKPIKIRNRLQIGFMLDQLFRATMQQPDMRVAALHHLTVKLQHQAQHAVRCRVLRSEIDSKFAIR